MVNFCPLTAEIGSGVWGTPANFNGFRVLLRYCTTSLAGGQPNFAQRLSISCADTNIHFRGLLPPDGILTGAKFTFTLHPSLAFFCIGSVKPVYTMQPDVNPV